MADAVTLKKKKQTNLDKKQKTNTSQRKRKKNLENVSKATFASILVHGISHRVMFDRRMRNKRKRNFRCKQ